MRGREFMKITEAREGNVKEAFIKVRVAPEEKEMIQKYCGEHGMNVSQLIRAALEKYLNE